MFRRQHGGGGLMIWDEIIDNTIVRLIRVPEGIKLISKTYWELLELVLLPWPEDLPLSSRRKVIFSKGYYELLGYSIGMKGDSLMKRPVCSPNFNPIENYWSIQIQQIYADWFQFFSKAKFLNDAVVSVPRAQIRKLTRSTNDRLF